MTAYGNIADWQTYADDRGNTAPAALTDIVAGQVLLRASDYIRTRYVIPLGRYEATDDVVVEATYIAASLELATPGVWATTFTPSQSKVLTKVEGIEWTVVGSGNADANDMIPVSPAISALFMGASAYGTAAVVV